MEDRDAIEQQLTRVLEFIPRVDAKASGLFAVNSAMLTIAALNLKPADLKMWFIGMPAALTLSMLLLSYFFLYRSNFPDIRGGEGSLIHFAEIEKRTEANFITEYEAADAQRYRRDLLGQIWRNSQIVCAKYKAVAAALSFTAFSLVPFIWLLIASGYVHAAMPALKG